MKKHLLFPLIFVGTLLTATAQITITNAVFPQVGDTLQYAFGNQAGAINQIFTPPGAGQNWDLSNLQATQYWDQIFKNPQTGSVPAVFPGATLLSNYPNSSAEVYFKATGNQVLDMGYYGKDPLGLGLTLLFVKLPSLLDSWAPVEWFQIYQSASNVLTAFDAPIAPPVLLNLVPTADSFRIRVTQQRIAAIDAWGTLTIPAGTFDVLRKKQTEYRSTAVDVKVAPLGWIDISTIGGQQLLPLGTDTITTFHFLNDVSKEAIAICTLNTAQNTVTSVQYKAVNSTSNTHAALAVDRDIVIYPNPAQNTLQVHFNSDAAATLELSLLDAQGKSVLVQRIQVIPGENDIPILVSHLTTGNYTLLLRDKGVVVGRARAFKL